MHNSYGLILTGILKMNGKKESYSNQSLDNLLLPGNMCEFSCNVILGSITFCSYTHCKIIFFNNDSQVSFEEVT